MIIKLKTARQSHQCRKTKQNKKTLSKLLFELSSSPPKCRGHILLCTFCEGEIKGNITSVQKYRKKFRLKTFWSITSTLIQASVMETVITISWFTVSPQKEVSLNKILLEQLWGRNWHLRQHWQRSGHGSTKNNRFIKEMIITFWRPCYTIKSKCMPWWKKVCPSDQMYALIETGSALPWNILLRSLTCSADLILSSILIILAHGNHYYFRPPLTLNNEAQETTRTTLITSTISRKMLTFPLVSDIFHSGFSSDELQLRFSSASFNVITVMQK